MSIRNEKAMNSYYQTVLKKRVEAIMHWSDVFSDPTDDFDAALTAIFRNLGTLSDRTCYVGGNTRLAGYGAVLLSDLAAERARIRKEIGEAVEETTVAGILNTLPREGYDIKISPNGRDFHLAITESGVLLFACPLATLTALDSRNAILALYRLPNERIPFTDGNREQFRSSIVAASRFRPDVFETVFEYENVDALVAAKENGTHPNDIPGREREIEFAFADRFGNVRLDVRDIRSFLKNLGVKFGETVFVRVGNSEPISALYTDSLAHVPTGILGLYENVADGHMLHRKAGYLELVKKSDHCLSDDTMTHHLLCRAAGNEEALWGSEIRMEKTM